MPALTVLEIEKLYGAEYWVNRYFLSTNIGDSGAVAPEVLALERSITDNRITFTKMSLRTIAEGDDVYATVPINLPGLKDWGGSDLLSLFNVVRVDFAAAVGRPSRKYLRGVLGEASTLAFNITDAVIATINTSYATPMAAIAAFCDAQGEDIISGACARAVGMRQLRRGSKKKVIPSSGGTPV